MIRGLNERIFSHASNFSVRDIHEISLRILREIGIPISSRKALDLLTSIGCTVDRNGRNVYIPEEVVDNALKAPRKGFDVHSRSGADTVTRLSGVIMLLS